MVLVKSKQIKKHQHDVHKDRPDIKQLNNIIQDQEELIINL